MRGIHVAVIGDALPALQGRTHALKGNRTQKHCQCHFRWSSEVLDHCNTELRVMSAVDLSKESQSKNLGSFLRMEHLCFAQCFKELVTMLLSAHTKCTQMQKNVLWRNVSRNTYCIMQLRSGGNTRRGPWSTVLHFTSAPLQSSL